MILRRIKNLWRLSEFHTERSKESDGYSKNILVKDFPTVEKKMATIIGLEKPDLFAPENEGNIA